MRFNIIYIPGTVEYLRLFALSLLRWSDCSFRLVANGCAPEETRQLQQLCAGRDRLEFLALPGQAVMTHGQALDYLHQLERGDHFCFMDSDILATGDFMGAAGPHLRQCAGYFSCSPIWYNAEEQVLPATFQRMGGRYNRSDQGVCLGSAYFAIYDNRKLTNLVESTGVGFRKYAWEDLPAPCQDQLAAMGLRKAVYDTGKVVNLLLQTRGERIFFGESPSLWHIGGISAVRAHDDQLLRRPPRGATPITKRLWRKIRRGVAGQSAAAQSGLTAAEIAATADKSRKRVATSRYFARLLQCLFEHRPLPQAPAIGDAEIAARIQAAARHIADAYGEFGQALSGAASPEDI